jgi:hypothetical protein
VQHKEKTNTRGKGMNQILFYSSILRFGKKKAAIGK